MQQTRNPGRVERALRQCQRRANAPLTIGYVRGELRSASLARTGYCVNVSAPQWEQTRKVSACWFRNSIAATWSLSDSVGRNSLEGTATCRRAAHRGTCQLYPHSVHVLVYSDGCHGRRIRPS